MAWYGRCDEHGKARRGKERLTMVIELNGVWIDVQQDRSAIISWAPQECTRCQVMTCHFINKNGETRCLGCKEAR